MPSFSWFSVDVLLYAIALPLVLRAFWVRISAEQGRRHDLLYRPPVEGNDFQVAVLVPLMNPDDELPFHDMLTCFKAQSYDLRQVRLVVLVSSHAYISADAFELSDYPASVEWLDAPPSASDTQEQLLQWGINRLLASHPPHLFVLLDAHDLVKPDFLSHTVSAAYQHEVYQGYIAHRDFGEGLMSRSLGLLTRLYSRVQSVGRFHGGLGVLFRESGLAFKANVVERFPIQHQAGLGYAPWSITLNQVGLRIHWVPNMIVYQRYYPDLFEHVEQQCITTLKALKSLALRLLQLARPQELEQRLACVPHNPLLNVSVLMSLAVLSSQNLKFASVCGSSAVWWTLASVQGVLWFTTLAVARIKPSEWFVSTFVVLGALAFQILAAPVAVFRLLLQSLQHVFLKNPNVFQEERMKVHLKQPSETMYHPMSTPAVSRPAPPMPQRSLTSSLPINALQTIETNLPLVLRFGSQEIVANLYVDIHTHADGLRYALELTYKTQRLHTKGYARLEEAYEELRETLAHFQIEPKTCGNCVHFKVNEGSEGQASAFNLPQQGCCGRSFSDTSSADLALLNVLSAPCEAHASVTHHATI